MQQLGARSQLALVGLNNSLASSEVAGVVCPTFRLLTQESSSLVSLPYGVHVRNILGINFVWLCIYQL